MTSASRHPRARSAERRRVLYVEACEDGTVGGSHQVMFDLVRQLDRRAFTPVVLFYQANRWVEPLRALDVEVIVYEGERGREKAPHLRGSMPGKLRSVLMAPVHRTRLLRRERIALLHLNNSPAEGYDDWLPAAKAAGVPCVAQASGAYVPPSGALRRWATRQHDRVIAISKFVEGTLLDQGMPSSRVVRISPGVDVEAFRARVARTRDDVRAELGVAPDTLLALMVGNLRHWKGQDVAIDALSAIPLPLRDRIHLAFAGATAPTDAAYAASLAESVRARGIDRNVTFLGARTDVPDLMNAADVVLHASRVPEPFGIVVVEGLALGKPVIASWNGGPAEVLTPECGRLHDPANPGQLAALLAELVRDPALRARLGAAAVQRAREFDISRMTKSIERVYDSLLGTRSAPSS